MSFEIRKLLKRMPCLAYTEMDQTKYRVSSMFASDALFGHCYTYLHVHTLAGLFQTIKVKETKMVYHSDEIPLDIGYSLTGLLPMHCLY